MSYDNPPPPPPGYEAQPYGAGAPKTSGKAIASMVTGLAGLLTCLCGFLVVVSITAIVLGVLARKEIAASGGRLQGNTQAMVGIVSGAVGVLLVIATIILYATGVIEPIELSSS
jgi:hypothetical protein